MHSTALYSKADTALLGEKRSYSKYNSLSSNRKSSSSAEDVSGLVKSNVRRKTSKDDQDIELKYTGNKTSDSSAKSNTVILTEDILPSDTLQSFSLRFGCSVNDIKRANGLITEQDFYALKKLKIPVSRYSLLTVPEEKQHHREVYDQFYSQASHINTTSLVASSNLDSELKKSFETTLPTHPKEKPGLMQNKNNDTPSSSEFDSSESLEETASLLTSSGRLNSVDLADKNDTNTYLKKLDKNIRKTVKKADLKPDRLSQNESLNEVLSAVHFYPEQSLLPQESRKTDGADCGLKWWAVILCFFLILVVVIALAVFEYYRAK